MGYDVHTVGSGPPLLLLHSGFCTWVEWRRLVDLLAVDHRVIAPTLPGSAGGPPLDARRPMLQQHAEYVEGLADELGLDQPVPIVGSSFGGVLALELLGRDRASSVVALAPPWTSGSGVAYFAALFAGLPAIGLTRRWWPRTTQSGLINGLWFHQSRTPPQIDAADVAILLDSWARFPFYAVGARSILDRNRPAGPGFPDLAGADGDRATFVWGGADRVVPPWMRRRWAAALPTAHVVHLDGFPHQPHLRDPAVIADLVRERLS